MKRSTKMEIGILPSRFTSIYSRWQKFSDWKTFHNIIVKTETFSELSVFSVHLKYIMGSCNCISTTNISYAYDALGQLIRVNEQTDTTSGAIGTTAEYKYTADGLRVQKKVTVSGTATTTNYILHGKNVVHMARGSTALHFWYDAQNRPTIVLYCTTRYAYVYNLQDGIVGVIDSTSVEVVKYTYDAWGKVLSTTGFLASTLGTVQPFRYWGDVYDIETGLYYLRSRYYNPE